MSLDMSLKNGLPLFRGGGDGEGGGDRIETLVRNKGQKEDRVQNETHTTSLLKTEMRLSCVLKSYRFFQGNKWRKAAMSGPLRNKSITVIYRSEAFLRNSSARTCLIFRMISIEIDPEATAQHFAQSTTWVQMIFEQNCMKMVEESFVTQ